MVIGTVNTNTLIDQHFFFFFFQSDQNSMKRDVKLICVRFGLEAL